MGTTGISVRSEYVSWRFLTNDTYDHRQDQQKSDGRSKTKVELDV